MWSRSGHHWSSQAIGIVPRHVRRLLVPERKPAPAPRALAHEDLQGRAAAEPARAVEADNLPRQEGGRQPESAARGQGGSVSSNAPHVADTHATPIPPPLAGRGSPQNQSEKSKRPAPPRKSNRFKLSELDALRIELTLALEAMLETWRDCPSRACRRAHACVSPGHECATLPRPPCSPAREAAAFARLSAGLKRRAAELAASGGAETGEKD